MFAAAVTATFCLLVCGRAYAFRPYPLYKQCDPAWGNNSMGVDGPGERSTICAEGCAMSSLAMALAGQGATVAGSLATPASLNAWLEVHDGYVCLDGDCNNLNLTAVQALNASWTFAGEDPKPPVPTIRAGIVRGDTIFIAHIPALVRPVCRRGASGGAGARLRGARAATHRSAPPTYHPTEALRPPYGV